MMKKQIHIEKMTCMHCVGRVRKYLEAQPGVSDVEVDLEQNRAVFTCGNDTDLSGIMADLTQMGYPASDPAQGG